MKYKVQQYFDKFSDKDLDGLRKMFHPDITLTDWDLNTKGIESVLQANANIFNTVDNIKITVLKMVTEENVVFSELLITVIHNDVSTFLNVVDVITFKDSKIYTIHAYKR